MNMVLCYNKNKTKKNSKYFKIALVFKFKEENGNFYNTFAFFNI